MLVKTSDLIGPALDWCVHQIEKDGWDVIVAEDHEGYYLVAVDADGWSSAAAEYSTDWSQGGPLIEENILSLHDCAVTGDFPVSSGWMAKSLNCHVAFGKTPLIAACRAIVAAKLGDQVDVPDELMQS